MAKRRPHVPRAHIAHALLQIAVQADIEGPPVDMGEKHGVHAHGPDEQGTPCVDVGHSFPSSLLFAPTFPF
jgi:hypothetical protein